ncbi:MAG: hypothetical protein ACR2ID_02955 [Chthoniobacterales bacterium]
MRPIITAAIVACLLALATAPLRAQRTVLPAGSEEDASARVLPTPPPRLIPDDVLPATPPAGSAARPTLPSLPELDASLLPPSLSPAADGYRRLIAWRKLRNLAQNDPEAKAALASAEAARTDLEKRKLLGRYYNVLYAKMTANAPADMKPYLQDRKRELQAGLPQPHVRPTPKPASTPTPAKSAPPPGGVVAPPPEPSLPVAAPSPAAAPSSIEGGPAAFSPTPPSLPVPSPSPAG